ncbi:MAG: hypothetical protein H0W95_04585, partial [Nocardioidaceae bacterium]|nr:hypothetical protein [Nocardioidaceae bacterium]
VEAVEDVVSIGQKIQVEIGEVDDRGKLSLRAVVDDDGSVPKTDAPVEASAEAPAEAASTERA